VLAEQSLDALLERIADTLRELVPYEELVVYEADNALKRLAIANANSSSRASSSSATPFTP
jgi:hypothetical protein